MQEKYGTTQETNLGCFREELANYLNKREDINNEKTLMVRLLTPNEFGVPVEIYCFTKTIVWEEYERIQSEIMEHIFITLPKFDLVYYQRK